jgi:hypothetical protein
LKHAAEIAAWQQQDGTTSQTQGRVVKGVEAR